MPAALRCRSRPFRLQLAGVLVAGVCLYGGVTTGKIWGNTGDVSVRPAAAGRRLDAPVDAGHGVQEGEAADAEQGAAEAIKPGNAYAAVCAFGLFYMFLGLAIVCDEFFVPALDVITEKLNLSPDVAGATFMAAGGSAPEFFTAMATALSKPPSDVGISAIVGSAVFNVLFVIGACGLAAPGLLELTSYPLARDSSFYVVHLILLCTWFYDGQIEWWESLIQFSMYIIYCIFMAYSENVESWFKNEALDETEFNKLDTDHDGLITREEAMGDTSLLEQFDKLDTDGDGKLSIREAKVCFRNRRALRQQSTVKLGEEPEPDEPVSLCPPEQLTAKAAAYYIMSLPIVLVLTLTVPDVRRPGGCWRSLYPITFALSIAWVAVFSWIMVVCAEVVGAWTEIDPRILGLTLIAAGTSVPDLLTSVIVTLNGHGDMAISSSIGSNIFDVTVGLPVPWLVYHAWYQGEAYPVESKPLTMFTQIGSLIAMLLAVVLSIKCTGWVLNKTLGGIMLVLYFVFLGVSVWQVMQEG